MDEGIFWFFYVIVEAIRNFFVYTPLNFMIFAFLVIAGVQFFCILKERNRNDGKQKE